MFLNAAYKVGFLYQTQLSFCLVLHYNQQQQNLGRIQQPSTYASKLSSVPLALYKISFYNNVDVLSVIFFNAESFNLVSKLFRELSIWSDFLVRGIVLWFLMSMDVRWHITDTRGMVDM